MTCRGTPYRAGPCRSPRDNFRSTGLEDTIADREKRPRSWVAWVAGGAGIGLVVVLAAAALYLTVLTVSFKVDGRAARLSAGSTVSDVFSHGLVDRKPGNLVSAKDHHILTVGGGGKPYLSANGVTLLAGSLLQRSANLESFNGPDVVERTRLSTEPIPIPTEYEGAGPVESVIQTGTPGVREVTVGVISKQVVSRRQLVAAVARVVRRDMPTAGARLVALTFDDGPWPGSTKAILQILQANGVKATFFEIGQQARQMSSLSRAVVQAGMEVGNHSETHPLNLGHLSAVGVANEIKYAQFDITRASGQAPKFFRPPGGNTTAAMFPVLSKLGLGWVQWDIDTDDWQRPSPANIVSRVVSNVRPGSVVLMHDGGGDRSHTVQALPQIIEKLKAMGYSFVTIDQLPSVPHRMG
jgi:peptidoglycan-N-acetylglucosamine deacetylase